MTLDEVKKRFYISMEKLKYYEENNLLKTSISPDGEKEYTEIEIRRVGIIHSLRKAGFDMDMVREYLKLLDDEKGKEDQVRILRRQ